MFEAYLNDVLNATNKTPAYYLAGSLCLDRVGGFDVVVFNIDGKGFTLKDGQETSLEQTEEEFRLVNEIFVKYKTDKSLLYPQAQENLRRIS